MNPRRSKRGWIAGLFAGVAAVGTVVLLHGLFELIDRRSTPPAFSYDQRAEWYDIALVRMEYLGRDPMGMIDAKSSYAVGMLLALAAVFVVTAIGTWLAARGGAPGSSVFPVFLSTWASFAAGAVVGHFGQTVWNFREGLDRDGAFIAFADGTIRTGSDYGLVWGFPVALLTALLWLMVRPRASAEPAGVPPGQQHQQPPYGQQPPHIEEPMWATAVQDPVYDAEHDSTRAVPGREAQGQHQAETHDEPGDGPDLSKRSD